MGDGWSCPLAWRQCGGGRRRYGSPRQIEQDYQRTGKSQGRDQQGDLCHPIRRLLLSWLPTPVIYQAAVIKEVTEADVSPQQAGQYTDQEIYVV